MYLGIYNGATIKTLRGRDSQTKGQFEDKLYNGLKYFLKEHSYIGLKQVEKWFGLVQIICAQL